MQGWQIGAKCSPSIEMAASDACAAAYGMTSGGLLSCAGYQIDGQQIKLTMSNGVVSSVTPMPCDRITYVDTWGPLFGALLVSTVAVWAVKRLVLIFRTHDDI